MVKIGNVFLLAATIIAGFCTLYRSDDGGAVAIKYKEDREQGRHRRLETTANDEKEADADDRWFHDVPRLLSRATQPPSSPTASSSARPPLRVLLVTTSLVEYDKGTRGTQRGYDRLRHVTLPPLVDAASSMTARGWDVDAYLVLGYAGLSVARREMIARALPAGVGLEVWEDAIPLHYAKTYGRGPRADQGLTPGDHGLSRQHRFVLRDKLPFYDFFVCFEDDIRITADHVLNFLELSSDILRLHNQALANTDHHAHVADPSPPRTPRHRPNDGAQFGNDVIDDPISAEHTKRLFPGLLRVEVLDRQPDHPLRRPGVLDRHQFVEEVPPSARAFASNSSHARESLLRPACCDEREPPRGKTVSHPRIDEVVLWETNVQAAGVRRFPPPVGWAAAMPVEDHADVGSYWSGHPRVYAGVEKRPRRVDATLGNQAGFMATRSQLEHLHAAACPGGFFPPFDASHWKGDSLQRHSVEFWSGGFQMFGQCFLNRILSLEPRKFEKQLIYHVSNNKQRTVPAKKFIRAGDFYGQLMKVKERAEEVVGQV